MIADAEANVPPPAGGENEMYRAEHDVAVYLVTKGYCATTDADVVSIKRPDGLYESWKIANATKEPGWAQYPKIGVWEFAPCPAGARIDVIRLREWGRPGCMDTAGLWRGGRSGCAKLGYTDGRDLCPACGEASGYEQDLYDVADDGVRGPNFIVTYGPGVIYRNPENRAQACVSHTPGQEVHVIACNGSRPEGQKVCATKPDGRETVLVFK
jgi:hypothetical protein